MASLGLFLAILSSGSAYACARHRRTYEEILPITCMSAVLILFLAGAAGHLAGGVVLVAALSLVLYAAAGIALVRRKSLKEFCSCFFTMPFFVFVFLGVLFVKCLSGMQFASYDEFTHWGECVKIMFVTDRFAFDSPHSLFPSYPPGMALFQYLFLKLVSMAKGGSSFDEWRACVAYRIFCAAFLVSLLGNIRIKKVRHEIICAAILFTAPLFYYWYFYSYVLIDPVLSVLGGAGFAVIMQKESKDAVMTAFVTLTCVMLVLTKDSGLFFAAFIALSFLVIRFPGAGVRKLAKPENLFLLLPLPAALAAKGIWRHLVSAAGRDTQFTNNVDIIDYTRIFFTNDTSAYRYAIVEKVKKALFTPPYTQIASTDFRVNYFSLFVVNALFLYLLYRAIKAVKGKAVREKWVLMILWLMGAFYAYSLGAIYVYNDFTDEEAARLACYDRYMNTFFLIAFICILAVSLTVAFRYYEQRAELFSVLCLCAVLTIIPAIQIKMLLNRDNVREAASYRANFIPIADRILEECGEDAKVYPIIQGGTGDEYYTLRYMTYPVDTDVPYGYFSIGDPVSKDDTLTWQCTDAEWKEYLEQYDYVAVYRLNDDFYKKFSAVFEDPDSIKEQALYRVDHSTGLLQYMP